MGQFRVSKWAKLVYQTHNAPRSTLNAPSPPSCHRCEAFRPDPQLSGNLHIDPEIHLPSPGMDVDIAYYYNSNSVAGSPALNGPFGYMRIISPAQFAQISAHNLYVQRGSGAVVQYNNATGPYLPQTAGVLNTLVQDNVNNLLKETTPEGITTAYPLNTAGYPTTVS